MLNMKKAVLMAVTFKNMKKKFLVNNGTFLRWGDIIDALDEGSEEELANPILIFIHSLMFTRD